MKRGSFHQNIFKWDVFQMCFVSKTSPQMIHFDDFKNYSRLINLFFSIAPSRPIYLHLGPAGQPGLGYMVRFHPSPIIWNHSTGTLIWGSYFPTIFSQFFTTPYTLWKTDNTILKQSNKGQNIFYHVVYNRGKNTFPESKWGPPSKNQ